MEYTQDKLKSLAHGACFLGCGGGGPLVTILNILESFPKDAIVSSVSLDEALQDSQGLTAVVAVVGSPSSSSDLQYPLLDVVNAFEHLNEKVKARYNGREITYLIPVEVGAGNTLVPFIIASFINKSKGRTPIKVIDADGAGRAVPMLTMSTYAANGISCNPSILSKAPRLPDPAPCGHIPPRLNRFVPDLRSKADGYNVSLEIDEAAAVETLIRPVLDNQIFNQFAGLALWMMDTAQLKKANPVPGTLTQAYNLGCALRDQTQSQPLFGRPVFAGKLCNIETHTSGGFDHSLATLQSGNEFFYIYIQNENILGWTPERTSPVIMAPDLLCYLATKFQHPDGAPEPMRVFSNARQDWSSFIGQEVTLLGQVCDPRLRQKPLCTPFAQLCQDLGYPGPYIPFDSQTEPGGQIK